MPHEALLEVTDVGSEAWRALREETSLQALESIARQLRDIDPDHEALLLIDAKIVALLIGIAPRRMS